MARNLWLLLLGSMVFAPPVSGAKQEGCSGRVLLARDGTPSDLDDCRLGQIFDGVDLRGRLGACETLARQGEVQVFGGFGFTFDLSQQGAAANLKIENSAFDKTPLPACLARELKRSLAGTALGKTGGKPALVEGKFTLRQGETGRFAFSFSGEVLPAAVSLTPLPGKLEPGRGGLVSTCALGKARLILQLSSAQAISPPAFSSRNTSAEQAVDACEQKLRIPRPFGWTPAEWNRERKQALGCLLGLLSNSGLEVRAAAAERLASEQYWHGRAALTNLIHQMVGIADCTSGTECQAKAPADAAQGLLLLRLVKAQLRLRHWVRSEVLDALAQHPAQRVRLGLITGILTDSRGKLPPLHNLLLQDPDPVVRARACCIGCQRDDRASLRAFRDQLESPDPEVRAVAVLYAGDCVRRAKRSVRAMAKRETDEIGFLLALQALPSAPAQLVEERVVEDLFNPCPAARFLAAQILGKAKAVPVKKLREALAREPNLELREQMMDLLGRVEGSPSPLRHNLKIWIQLHPLK